MVCYRLKKADFAKLLRQTEQFKWEDFPLTDESGNRTIASLLPIIRKLVIHLAWLIFVPHTIYMYIRGADPDKLGLAMWTPFDTRPSPVHEIVITIQVVVPYVAKLTLSLLITEPDEGSTSLTPKPAT
jgi:hypothetical protein